VLRSAAGVPDMVTSSRAVVLAVSAARDETAQPRRGHLLRPWALARRDVPAPPLAFGVGSRAASTMYADDRVRPWSAVKVDCTFRPTTDALEARMGSDV
jgi:hypothetical protein